MSNWIDRHSVNCIECGILFDEREGYNGNNGEGTVCSECAKNYIFKLDNEDELDRMVKEMMKKSKLYYFKEILNFEV